MITEYNSTFGGKKTCDKLTASAWNQFMQQLDTDFSLINTSLSDIAGKGLTVYNNKLDLSLQVDEHQSDHDFSFDVEDADNNNIFSVTIPLATDANAGLITPDDYVKLSTMLGITGLGVSSGQGDNVLFMDDGVLKIRKVYGLKENTNGAGTKLNDYAGVISGAYKYNLDLIYPQIYIYVKENEENTHYSHKTAGGDIVFSWSDLYRHGVLYNYDTETRAYIEVRGSGPGILYQHHNDVRVYLNLIQPWLYHEVSGPREFVEYGALTYSDTSPEWDGTQYTHWAGIKIPLTALSVMQSTKKAYAFIDFQYTYTLDANSNKVYTSFLPVGFQITGIE